MDGTDRQAAFGSMGTSIRKVQMKLYNVPRNSRIVLSNGAVLLFHHIDGMYSVCTDENGDIFHISATEEVTI
jgi:hypothetical protein